MVSLPTGKKTGKTNGLQKIQKTNPDNFAFQFIKGDVCMGVNTLYSIKPISGLIRNRGIVGLLHNKEVF